MLLGLALLCIFLGLVLRYGVRALPLLAVSALTAFLAWPAFAQDAAPAAPAPLLSPEVMAYILLALAVVEVARRVAAIVPGRRDDEIVGTVEGLLRRLVDFLGGVPKDPADPGLVRRDAVASADEDEDWED